ncbi:MAG: glycosyltransferase family 2 protein [Planctomyces sp.]
MNTPCQRLVRDRRTSRISVVLPVFNEAAILRELTSQLQSTLNYQTTDYEIIYVNDGSSDGSRELLNELSHADERIIVVHLARNFGHQPAVHAGLQTASGDAVILMDSDLQDDPKAIPAFLDAWEHGFDVVYARRFNRKESLPKRILFHSFYRILNSIASIAIPEDAGNFGLMDRRAVDVLNQLPENDRYFPGLRSWVGFRQTGVDVERAARHDGTPRVSMHGLFRLAKTAIFSFSTFPLTFFFVIAVISAAVCMATCSFALFHKLLTGLAIPGWASIIGTASFFGSLNALGISILGEYVVRIYDQVRGRPVYVAETLQNGRGVQKRTFSTAERSAISTEESIRELLESIHRDSHVLSGLNLESGVSNRETVNS